MTEQNSTSRISFGKFLRLTIEYTIFALPLLIILMVFQCLHLDALLFFLAPFSVLGILISAGIIYLIAKGSSNDLRMNNYKRSVLIAGGVFPGQLYGVLFGGLMGNRFWQTAGAIVGALSFFMLGSLAGARITQFLVDREWVAKTVQT